MKALCDECDTIVDTDEDFSMILILDEGLDTERRLCFCSMSCANVWGQKQGEGEE